MSRGEAGNHGREVALLRAENARLREQLAAEQRRLARERYAACHDQLTGLPNRRDLYERFHDLPADQGLAALMLDLNKFKPVNDEVGHRAGDRVLVEVARRLGCQLGDRWLVARLGGDEFAAVRAGPFEQDSLIGEATDLASAIGQPVLVGERVLRIGCSIGIATCDGPLSLPDLLGQADAALARSKYAGGPVVWHPRSDDDTARGEGVRPVVRTRDLRRVRYEDVSLLVVADSAEDAVAIGGARVHSAWVEGER
jgi:diguanylate cyclase (GGDEF)-like protein